MYSKEKEKKVEGVFVFDALDEQKNLVKIN